MEKKKERRAGIVIIICAAIVIAWEAAGLIANRTGDDFELKPEDLASFDLDLPGWSVEKLEVTPTFMEVNLLKLRLSRSQESGGRSQKNDLTTEYTKQHKERAGTGANAPILVRLVHGYNMVDCMRIKGYTVEKLNGVVQSSRFKVQGSESSRSLRSLRETSPELWQLTSSSGDTSLWLSGMLRAGDFAATELSTTDMAFPRIGVPDDPNWMPRGLTLKSFRHPVRNLKWFFRAKWNNSRCDLLTFLGLRKPAWASDDALTLLVILDYSPQGNAQTTEDAAIMADVYSQALQQLQEWRAKNTSHEGHNGH
jgi:hypothetical protein